MIAYRQPHRIDPLTESTGQLQGLLMELLKVSQQLHDAGSLLSPVQLRHPLALARLCARLLEGLEVGTYPLTRPPIGRHVPLSWAGWLDQAAENACERTLWQALLNKGQYLALVQQVEGKLLPDIVASRRRGMMGVTRCLAEHALLLKRQGVSWTKLLDAIIQELQAELAPDAEQQVLLAQLLDRQPTCQPRDNGAYLRLIVGRYKAEPGLFPGNVD